MQEDATADTGTRIEWAISDRPIGYLLAQDTMNARAAAIAEGRANEMVWLLEHPPLYTSGTSAQPQDLIVPNMLPVFETGRGGQYTYHGPGQRVAYLMLNLRQRGGDVRALISDLERWIVITLAAFNVKGEKRPGRVGTWVRRPEKGVNAEDKIAAIGLRVVRGVTTHGISLNVDPDLSHYRGIIPCGIRGHGVTSLADLGLPVSMTDADVALRQSFEAVFGPVDAVDEPVAAAGLESR
jgi:lipoyl(octanoyl) transferase